MFMSVNASVAAALREVREAAGGGRHHSVLDVASLDETAAISARLILARIASSCDIAVVAAALQSIGAPATIEDIRAVLIAEDKPAPARASDYAGSRHADRNTGNGSHASRRANGISRKSTELLGTRTPVRPDQPFSDA